jgi:hypothetical protein
MKYTLNTFYNFINQYKNSQDSSFTLNEWLIENRIIPTEIYHKDIYNVLKEPKNKKDFYMFFYNNEYPLTNKKEHNIKIPNNDNPCRKELSSLLKNNIFTYYEEILLYFHIKYYPECHEYQLPINLNRNMKRVINGISINEKSEISLNIVPEDLLFVYNIIKHNKNNIYTNVKYNTDKLNNHEIFLDHIYNGILEQVKQWTMD